MIGSTNILCSNSRRSIKTHSIDGICAVINNAASCLEEDYVTALRTPLKSGYPSGYIDLAQAYNAFQSSIQQGKIHTSDNEQARTNFIIHLNNTDMSTEFIETLWSTIKDEIKISFSKLSTKECEILDSCLSGLKSVRDTLKTVADFGLQQLRATAIKPRLHTWVDQFISLNHTFSEVRQSVNSYIPQLFTIIIILWLYYSIVRVALTISVIFFN